MTNLQLIGLITGIGGLFSICVGGFFYLNKRLDLMAKDVKENHVIQSELRRIFKSLEKIEISLNGADVNSPGLIGMVREHDKSISQIKDRCNIEHGKS